MTHAFIMLGKNGDICSILPIILNHFLRSGEKQIVVTSKAYASIFEGCSYVTPDIYEGEWHDLRGALKYAKRKYLKVSSLSSFGENFPIEHRCPSFQQDQWLRGGELLKFGELPLAFDNRDAKREAALLKSLKLKKGKFILFCGASESSPFDKADELRTMLDSLNLPIVNLSDIKAERIYDLIGLYDNAALLVTVETVHIHLSAASKVPVVALITDKPERWHGSAFTDRLRVHCRYGDFERRRQEIAKAISDAVAGIEPLKPKTITGIFENSYNPSLAVVDGKLLMSYRYHPAADQRSALAICQLTDDLKVRRNWPIKVPEELGQYAIEDGRLFMFKGKLHISFTVTRLPMPPFRCVVAYGELSFEDGEWRIKNPVMPKYGHNDFSAMEKNWVFFEHDGKLFAIYGGSPQVVLEFSGEKFVEHKSELPSWAHGQPHGGTTPVLFNGRMIRFFHSRTDDAPKPIYWRYFIGASVMDSKPPFAVQKISSSPIFAGDEGWKPNVRFQKYNIVFPGGCVVRGDKLLLAYGYNDRECRICELTELNLML